MIKDLSTLSTTSHYITLKGVQGIQFNHSVISTQCTVNNILKFMDVDKSVQRDTIEQQISNISKYIQYGLDGNDIYFPPMIFSARGKGTFHNETNDFHLDLDDKMYILDGQHRIKAFELLTKRLELKNDPINKDKLKKILNFPLSIQIFTNLTTDQERQLFTDLNTKSSRVNNTLLIMYKNNDLCGELVKEIIQNHPSISEDRFEIRSKTTRTKLMTSATLYSLINVLNEGLLGGPMVIKSKINPDNYKLYKKRTEEFLTLLIKYAPEYAYDRNKHIIFIPNIISSIALFIYTIQKKNPAISMELLFERVIKSFDWTHKNKELRNLAVSYNPNTKKYNFTTGVRTIKSISQYLEKIFEGGKK